MRSLLLAFLLAFCCLTAKGQTSAIKALEYKIDSLAAEGLPKSALPEVNKLDQLYRKNKNTGGQLKATFYRLTFLSFLEEKAMVPIIQQMQKDIAAASFPVKPVLQSVLAEMYQKYYEQNRYQFRQRSQLAVPSPDFTQWDLRTMLEQIATQHQLALQDQKPLQQTPITVLGVALEGDRTTRPHRPTLYDLLAHRALDFYLNPESDLPKAANDFKLNDPAYFGSSATFARLKLPTQDTTANLYLGLRLLQQATQFHLTQNNQEALADLELKRLEMLLKQNSFLGQGHLYTTRLKEISSTFSRSPLTADAAYLLGKYYQTKDSLVTALTYFNTAIAKFPASVGGQNAAASQQEILKKSIEFKVEDVVPAQGPILAQATYQNLNSARFTVYPLTEAQFTQIQEIRRRLTRYGSGDNGQSARAELHALLAPLKPNQQQQIALPNPGNHKPQISEFKIEALPLGMYAVLLQGGTQPEPSLQEINLFTVTDLAFSSRTNPDGQQEVRVMHRQTGKPLAQVKVVAEAQEWNNGTRQRILLGEGFTDTQGKILFNKDRKHNNLSFWLTAGKDHYLALNEYYYWNDNARDNDSKIIENTILFTDRQIYRPGQTLYFKGIQVRKVNGKTELVTNGEMEVELLDDNDETLGTLELKTNEYGSFSGSFQIPVSVLTGVLTLEVDNESLEVRVEEYKRPSFQISFDPVKTIHRFNDSVQVTGKVAAYAGYGLTGAKVQYKVVRESVYNPAYYNNPRNKRSYQSETLLLQSGHVTADTQGEFKVNFKAYAELVADPPEQQYVYSISATATDASGETQSQYTAVLIGQKALNLSMYLPDRILLPDSLTTFVRMTNLNQELQAGTITVDVYQLKSPEKLYKNRLWNFPTTQAWQKGEFEKSFPTYAPQENEYYSWPIKQKLLSQTLIGTATYPAVFKAALPSKTEAGVYLVHVQGTSLTGDTVSMKDYITLVSPKNHQVAELKDWVIPVKVTAETGDKAEFLVGAGPSHVLMEVYNGPTLESSEWLQTGGKQKLVEVPIQKTYGTNVQVQFLMVQDNRVYTALHKLNPNKADPSLALTFSTFRNKLLPGQKETWKLRISDVKDKTAAAEMVATLYDASLDKILGTEDRFGMDWYRKFTDGTAHERTQYFTWARGQFVKPSVSQSLQEIRIFTPIVTRNYEQLHYFGYSYFGGYNQAYHEYLNRVKRKIETENSDRSLEETYKENAAQIKNGVEVTGYILDKQTKETMPGVTVTLKGTNITTFSNSKGFFRIKVPVNGVLEFAFIGYNSEDFKITKAGSYNIHLQADTNALSEVVVTGYGVQERREVTGSVSTVSSAIYGSRSMSEDNLLQAIAEGVKITPSKTSATTEKLQGQPITLRKNFQETAFFYPHLQTDRKGNISLEFTVPEALTLWQFKGLAHTKKLEWGLLEGQVMTQKLLMVSPYLPRFLREGDTITVSARIVNLSSENLTGNVSLQFFNAFTNQPVNLFQNQTTGEQKFTVAAASTTPAYFQLVVPSNLEALTYRITAQAKDFSDGEENTVPVLSNSILVTETLPLLVRPGQTKIFTLQKLANQKSTTLKSQTLTFEYTQNPVWSAVQALPYLMEYPYECAEQTFSRVYANSVAAHIVKKSPIIKKVFDQWKAANSQELLSNLEKNPELKQTLLAETPWLRDARTQGEQQKRIALLFDFNKMENELTANLAKLEEMQFADGSFPWFAGLYPDRYISHHILAGIGQLEKLGVVNSTERSLSKIKTRGLSFLDIKLLDDYQNQVNLPIAKQELSATQIHAWYTRSYFTATPLSQELQKAWQAFQVVAQQDWLSQSIYEQGLLALTMQRFGKPELTQKIIKSLLERSQASEELGLYWPQNQRGYFWNQAPVETQVLLIELFTEAQADPKHLAEMKLWLLRNKQTNHWQTTKATAAACYALLLRGEDWVSAENNTSAITLGGKSLESLAPDLKRSSGSGYLKTSWAKQEITPKLGNVAITNQGTTPSWGALYWQYLEQSDKVTSAEGQLKLTRQYFVQETTNGRDILKPINKENPPKVGDLIKVVVYLQADREFEYIHLKDLRPAGTEPVDALSGRRFQDGLSYYQSTRDASTNFFISRLGTGNYVFEYKLRVAHAGDFATGITTIQSMYAPEFNAHTSGGRIIFKKQ
ncbi:alpha-2-macroglobulin [Rufibacter sp. LB8]|uniref:alpha-2-macroglobulin family protein n=1 Tax=Rufibacter sp. LB8 TaxID=2777781 RepID=UPI00178C4379|nr:alpha-2-macroglobulin family protein [Rufibacter sp. LB8]